MNSIKQIFKHGLCKYNVINVLTKISACSINNYFKYVLKRKLSAKVNQKKYLENTLLFLNQFCETQTKKKV